MEEVIHYLELKNQYYEKFYNVTVKFLTDARNERWADLEFFVDNRERILNIIRSFDFKIATLFERLDLTDCDLDIYRSRVKALLDERSVWAKKIVALDLDLIAQVDEMKSETIRELKKTVQTAHQLSAFSGAPSPRPLPKPPKEI